MHLIRMEFLVIRDLDVEPLNEGENDEDSGSKETHGRIVAYAEFKYYTAQELKSQKRGHPTSDTETDLG